MTTNGNGHAAFLMNFAIEINLGALFGKIAAGQTAQHRQGGVSLIPTPQPGFAVEVVGVDKDQPAIGAVWFNPSFKVPIPWAIGFLDLVLSKMKCFDLGARKGVERQG